MSLPEERAGAGWHIVSYPRRGNHLVRALIEHATGRPTLGCAGERRDQPIALREPNRIRRLIRITDHRPIGWKAHRLREVVLNAREAPGAGLLLVVRSPERAITSQLFNMVRKRKRWWLSERELVKLVAAELDAWLALVHLWRGWTGRKLAVAFEDLVVPDAQLRRQAVERLLASSLGRPAPDMATIDTLYELARESQNSRARHGHRQAARIHREVARWKIDYPALCRELGVGVVIRRSPPD